MMRTKLQQFLSDERGATAIEYALIAGIIAIGIVTSLGTVKDGVVAWISSTSDGLKSS